MPYISTETVRNRRKMIRKMFPDFKFSITTENYTLIRIVVKSGPIDLLMGASEDDYKRGYEQINHFWYRDHYKDYPEKVEFLDKIMSVANKDNGTQFIDGDYGAIPEFYVRISIGDWENPYRITPKK